MRLCELRIYFVVVVLDNGGEIDIETRPISTRKENEKNLKQFSRLPRSLYTYTQFSRGPRFLLFCAEVNREADRVPSRFECGTRCQFFLIPPFVPLPFVLMYLTVATLPHIRYHWVSGGGREFCKRVGDVHKYLTTTQWGLRKGGGEQGVCTQGRGEGCCSGIGIFHDASGQQRPLARSRGFTGSCKGDAP